MSAMKFFFEFFLEEKCGGNKSLCARELSLHDRGGIHKALDRFDSGGGIGATATNLIERLIERDCLSPAILARQVEALLWKKDSRLDGEDATLYSGQLTMQLKRRGEQWFITEIDRRQ